MEWDASKLVMAAHGSCADFDVPDGTWPASGTGIGQSFTETKTGPLTELYWFAGYAYGAGEDTTSFRAVPHPAQGAVMVDDAVPPSEDEIAAFGRLGVGSDGSFPCSSSPGSEDDTSEGSDVPPTPGAPGGEDEPDEGEPPPQPYRVLVRDWYTQEPVQGATLALGERYFWRQCLDEDCAEGCSSTLEREREVKSTTGPDGIAETVWHYERCRSWGDIYQTVLPTGTRWARLLDEFTGGSPSAYVGFRGIVPQGLDVNACYYLVPKSHVASQFAPVLHRHKLKENWDNLDNFSTTLANSPQAYVFSGVYILNPEPVHYYHSSSPRFCTQGHYSDEPGETQLWLYGQGAIPRGAAVGQRPVYYHVFNDEDGSVIVQYHFWWNGNQLGGFSAYGSHEGDWEHCAIRLSWVDHHWVPQAVNLSRHDCKRTFLPQECWWSPSAAPTYYGLQQGWDVGNSHLHVWVAARSHAIYNRHEQVYNFDHPAAEVFWDRVDYGLGDQPRGDHSFFAYDQLRDMGEVRPEAICHDAAWQYHYVNEQNPEFAFVMRCGWTTWEVGYANSPQMPTMPGGNREWHAFGESSGNLCFAHQEYTEFTDSPNTEGQYIGQYDTCLDGSGEVVTFTIDPLDGLEQQEGYAVVGGTSVVFAEADAFGRIYLGSPVNGAYTFAQSRIGGSGTATIAMYSYSELLGPLPIGDVTVDIAGCGTTAVGGPGESGKELGPTVTITPNPILERATIRAWGGVPERVEVFNCAGQLVATVAMKGDGMEYHGELNCSGRKAGDPPGRYLFVRVVFRSGVCRSVPVVVLR